MCRIYLVLVRVSAQNALDQARRPAKEREREAHQTQDKDRWKTSDVGSKIGSMERACVLDSELIVGRNVKLASLRCTSHLT